LSKTSLRITTLREEVSDSGDELDAAASKKIHRTFSFFEDALISRGMGKYREVIGRASRRRREKK
jgi:hypothetical protein